MPVVGPQIIKLKSTNFDWVHLVNQFFDWGHLVKIDEGLGFRVFPLFFFSRIGWWPPRGGR